MTRKLALDVCEMVIKWELLRLQQVEQLTQGLTSHDDEVLRRHQSIVKPRILGSSETVNSLVS